MQWNRNSCIDVIQYLHYDRNFVCLHIVLACLAFSSFFAYNSKLMSFPKKFDPSHFHDPYNHNDHIIYIVYHDLKLVKIKISKPHDYNDNQEIWFLIKCCFISIEETHCSFMQYPRLGYLSWKKNPIYDLDFQFCKLS